MRLISDLSVQAQEISHSSGKSCLPNTSLAAYTNILCLLWLEGDLRLRERIWKLWQQLERPGLLYGPYPNNTEMFIDKLCEHEDQQYVMRQVRIEGTNRANAKFQEHLLKSQQARALATRKKQPDAEIKKREEIARLISVGLIVDCAQINKMTIPQLNDQISIHRKFFNDKVLLKVPQKDLKTKFFKLSAVLAAIT